MSNPFEVDTSTQSNDFTANPFDAPSIITHAAGMAKEQILSEAGNIFQAARALDTGMKQAAKSKNEAWMTKLHSLGQKLLEVVSEFMKRAIQLALAKFVLELCAMVINQIMAALAKAGSGRMDISSPNVYYNGNGQPQVATQNNPYGNYSRSPFEGGLYSHATNSASPW